VADISKASLQRALGVMLGTDVADAEFAAEVLEAMLDPSWE